MNTLILLLINFLRTDKTLKMLTPIAQAMTGGNLSKLISVFLKNPRKFANALKHLKTSELEAIQEQINETIAQRRTDKIFGLFKNIEAQRPELQKLTRQARDEVWGVREFYNKVEKQKGKKYADELRKENAKQEPGAELYNEWYLLESSWMLYGKYNYDTHVFSFTTKARPAKVYDQPWNPEAWQVIKNTTHAGTFLWRHHPLWIAKIKTSKTRRKYYNNLKRR